MFEIRQTQSYSDWFSKLRDRTVRARINIRLRRLSLGNPGDVKSVGEGVFELRIHFGPGYRVYYTQCGQEIIVLLIGGDKSTQSQDIQLAQTLARNL